MLPREHGAWAVLAVPILAGFFAAEAPAAWIVVSFSAAAFGGYCLRAPLVSLVSARPDPAARKWLAAWAALAAAGTLPLCLAGRWGLLAFALPAGLMLAADLRAHRERATFSASNEAAGILTLCLGAPAAYYAAAGVLRPGAWAAWALCCLYFLGPILHVKTAALQHRGRSDPALLPALGRMARASRAYHAGAAAGILALAAAGWVPPLVALPFLAALAKALRRAGLGPDRVDFGRLGRQELAHAGLFTLALGLAL